MYLLIYSTSRCCDGLRCGLYQASLDQVWWLAACCIFTDNWIILGFGVSNGEYYARLPLFHTVPNSVSNHAYRCQVQIASCSCGITSFLNSETNQCDWVWEYIFYSAEVAQHITEDSHGLIFGINTFIALVLQTILTIIVADSSGLQLPEPTQFVVYGSCYIIAGVVYFIIAIISLLGFGCCKEPGVPEQTMVVKVDEQERLNPPLPWWTRFDVNVNVIDTLDWQMIPRSSEVDAEITEFISAFVPY